MADKATFSLKKRNPDVLTCIANLSNDEVFTPPEFAKQMLDTLEKAWADANNGANIWEDRTVTFLDPCTKSGVFLREIVERLSTGLESQIPDLRKRVDHILTKQVFGIGITHLTSLLARRSVYCSKFANGEHSVASSFADEEGNIWFESLQHTWVGGNQVIETADNDGNPIQKKLNGRCKFCGASQKEFDRASGLETHAYAFIHTEEIKNFVTSTFGDEMQFDVIVGNPPYQLSDGGGGKGSSATPLYNLFVDQALKLQPRFLSMVIPARWFSGGKGLDGFRSSMLQSRNFTDLVYYPDSSEVFSGTDFGGGICYFIHDLNYDGPCDFVTNQGGRVTSSVTRYLDEDGDVFVAMTEARPILQKIRQKHYETFETHISSRKPFGITSGFKDYKTEKFKDSILLQTSEGPVWIAQSQILTNVEWLPKWKVIIGKAYGERGPYPYRIISEPRLLEPHSACTETYLVGGVFDTKEEAERLISYVKTRLFRFLLALQKNTQNVTKEKFSFVPVMTLDRHWNDDELFEHFGIDDKERDFIVSIVREMVTTDE